MKRTVKQIIAQHLGLDEEPESSMTIEDELGGDQLDLLEIQMAVEDEYGIEASDVDLFTVADFERYAGTTS